MSIAVVSVIEVKEGGSAAGDLLRTAAKRKFLVDLSFGASTDIPNGPLAARDASGIPLIGSEHPGDAWLFATGIDCNHVQGNSYEVLVSYESIDDPTAQPYTVEFDNESTTEPIDEDNDENPLTNSADEPLEVTEEFFDLVMRISFYDTVFSTAQAVSYLDRGGAVNSTTWFGCAAKTVRLTKYKGTKEKIGTHYYYKLEFEFKFRGDTWRRRFLDQGLREKTALGEYTYLKDENGDPVTTPVKLDGSGAILTSGDPVFLTFDTKNVMDFFALPINTALI